MKKIIQPEENAEFNRRFGFSSGVESDGLIFVSGQVGNEPDGNVPEDPARQFELAFESVGRVLAEAGASFADIVELTTYHVGLQRHTRTFAEVKSRFIQAPFPAWTAVGVTELVLPGLLAEIQCVARKP